MASSRPLVGVLGVVGLGDDVPVDVLDLLRLFDSSYLLLSRWASVAPCCVGTFANCTFRSEAVHSFLSTVLGLV